MKKPKQIFILTASIGTGHSQAARAIAEAINLLHPEDSVRVLDFVSRSVWSMDHMIKDTYLNMIRLFPDVYDNLYASSRNSQFGRLSQNLLSLTFKKKMRRLAEALRPDALIFTHPFPAGAADSLKKSGDLTIPLLGVITDFDIHQLWIDPHLDGFCVATEELKAMLAGYSISSKKIHVTGIPVRKAFCEEGKKERQPEKGTVLIMGGGLGLGKVIDNIKLLDPVEEISKFIVITGQNIALYEEIASLSATLRHPVELHSYTNKVAEIMSRSELLVTKPGALTCTEAMTINLPMVLINTLPGQERANAAYMANLGCARWIKRIQLAETVRQILTDAALRNSMIEACDCSHPDSARKVVELLYTMMPK